MAQNNIKTRVFDQFKWIDVTHPDKNALEDLTGIYHLDIKLLEDSIEHGHLPKMEKVGNHIFIILRAYTAHTTETVTTVGELSNKIAFFVNKGEIITIHRKQFPFLEEFNDDYNDPESLMIDIVNAMTNTFREPLESQSKKMDAFEREVFLQNVENISLKDLYFQKSKARISKKLLALTHVVLNQWDVHPDNKSKLQDVKDSILDFELLYDEVVEDAQNLLNSYLSITSQKNNEVMKLLTVFSVFFLPLTFIVGVYGMNFHFMPEITWRYAYFWVWVVMLLISIGIYYWFKRKKIL